MAHDSCCAFSAELVRALSVSASCSPIMSAMVVATALLALVGQVSGQWTLKDGSKVSFIFVQPSQKQVWRPDGTEVSYDSIPKTLYPVWQAGSGIPILVVLTNTTKPTRLAPAVRYKLPATGQLNAQFFMQCRDRRIWMSGYTPADIQPELQDVAIGVASEPWKVSGWSVFQRTGNAVVPGKKGGTPFKFELSGTPPNHSSGPFTMLNIPEQQGLENSAYRFVIRDKSGKELPAMGSNPSPDKKGVTNYTFLGDWLSVARVELQIRTFEWTTFKVAHFKAK